MIIEASPPHPACSRTCRCLCPQRLHPEIHLLGCDVFDMGGDGPPVVEGIDQCGGAVAVELVLQRAFDRGAGLDRPGDDLIGVLDIQAQPCTR